MTFRLPLIVSITFLYSSSAFSEAELNCDTQKEVNGYIVFITVKNCHRELHLDRLYSAKVKNAEGSTVLNSELRLGFDPTEISVIELDKYLMMHYLFSSTSNINHLLEIYDTAQNLKHIGSVNYALNKYQANNRNASEREIAGFYKSNGIYLIDSLTSKGQPFGGYNACQTYSVKTSGLINNKLVDLYLRDFDIENYKPLQLPFSSLKPPLTN